MSVTFYTNLINYAGYSASAEPSITTQGYACSGGETTGPAYDLLDGKRTNLITIDTDGETGAFTVDIDMTSAPGAGSTFGIIDNHNFNTADAEIKFTYGGSTTTIVSAYEGSLGSALSASTVTANVVQEPADGILLATWSDLVQQNYEVSIEDDGGSNFGADVTMGEVFIGRSVTPSFSPELNAIYTHQHKGTSVVESESGVKYGFSNHDDYQKGWTLNWKYLSDTDKSNLEYVSNVTRGSKHPFYIDLGESATPQLYFVRFVQSSLRFTQLTKDAWGVSVSIEEEL